MDNISVKRSDGIKGGECEMEMSCDGSRVDVANWTLRGTLEDCSCTEVENPCDDTNSDGCSRKIEEANISSSELTASNSEWLGRGKGVGAIIVPIAGIDDTSVFDGDTSVGVMMVTTESTGPLRKVPSKAMIHTNLCRGGWSSFASLTYIRVKRAAANESKGVTPESGAITVME